VRKELLIMGWIFLSTPLMSTQHNMALAHKLKKLTPSVHGRSTHETEGTKRNFKWVVQTLKTLIHPEKH